ncbi:MAG TPA: ParB/RepB/Spo0J family partition protein, partial [Candidatus Sulfomarinibacteraceae bacterium]|nr:ParB/RepB/Spo0J family partition protein [Candidatus Sulfomarinibacteraceae bacterium]
MIDEQSANYEEAKRDFRRARQLGALESAVGQLRGKSTRLLGYGEVSEQLGVGEATPRGLQQVPLDAIVGSVGRYSDFTRSFLPRRKTGQERWARVRAAFDSVEEMPPIVVYRLGDSYFVLDGNHRVSVAHILGATHIPAYVTDIESRVSLTPDTQPDDLICSAKYAEFLKETQLDDLRPEADLTVTAPGQYRLLLQQIHGYWAWLKREKGADSPLSEAVTGWYDEIYMPLVKI